MSSSTVTHRDLADFASQLAQEAGRRIMAGFNAPREVSFKDAYDPRDAGNSNPVTSVDVAVEAFLREAIQRRFPTHGLVGEEGSLDSGSSDFTWVLDPIDGTANFCNGIPLFSCCIGVLENSAPIAGAIWSSSTHRAVPGVYAASRGARLTFDGQPLERLAEGSWQGISTQYEELPFARARFNRRLIGSAGVELCYLAAGVSRLMHSVGLRIWDLAAGIPLLQACGQQMWFRDADRWLPLTQFGSSPPGAAGLAAWRHDILAGDPAIVPRLLEDPALR